MNNRSIILKYLAAIILLFALACTSWTDHYIDDEAYENNNVLQILKTTSGTDEFIAALEETGLDKVVAGADVFTVFVPPAGSFSGITGDELKKLVSNHIVFGRYYFENLTDSLVLQSIGGKYFQVNSDDGSKVNINNRLSLIAVEGEIVDKEARNGVIHSVQKVIEVVPNIEEQFQQLDPNKYSIFLEYYNKYDSIHPDLEAYKLGFNGEGGVILSTEPYWEFPSFNASDEEHGYCLLIPSDEAILNQRSRLVELNGNVDSRISQFYYTRLIRNQMLRGAYNETTLFNADTIITEGENWVVGKKLNEELYSNQIIASNGYILEASDIIYEPTAVDFLDSIVYEAEWSLGFDGHEKTLIYDAEMQPTVGGNGSSVNYHLFGNSLLSWDKIDIFVPNMYKGLYKVKMAYQWSNITVGLHSEGIPITNKPINLQTYIGKDINNLDPNYWAYGEVGYVFLQEDGNLHIGIQITNGVFAALMIDKLVFIPLEY